MPLDAGAVVDGRYTLERVLGRGATAVVWLARDGTTGSDVALKILHAELAETSLRRQFAREIQRTGDLGHPRILPVLAHGEVEDTLYYVQPHMAGGTLRERLDREGQLPVADVLQLGESLARALAHAHGRGLIHRDVKPENILFADGEAHLADFGVCRAIEQTMDESTTTRVMVRGTPAYMSPEQAAGVSEYDGRSDVFSLGAVLYECLAGVPAFIGASADAIIAQVIAHEPRDIRVYRATIPESVVAILTSCLEKRPADRFRDANGLAEALARSDRRSGGAVRRVRKPRPRAIALAALGIAVLAMPAVAWLWSGTPSAPAPAPFPVDTTLLVIYPFERQGSGVIDAELDDDLLRDGFRRGRGVDLVDQIQVEDALRRRPADSTSTWAAELARELGAGRYVRGQLRSRSGGTSAYIALYDVQTRQALYETRIEVPRALDAAADAYASAAAALLVRGEAGLGDSAPPRFGWSIPALQGYAEGQRALAQWDLVRADTLFGRSLAFDAMARTQLALAQVRAWMRRPVRDWRELARRALADEAALPARERRLAQALVALAEFRYDSACAEYDALRRQNTRDFAAWYGLGQCRSMDETVVPDTTTPSGWRFRSSRHAAFLAYTKAFDVLPTVHLGFDRDGLDTKGMFILVATDVRSGFSEEPRRLFLARPSWQGDTLAMIPYPIETISAGGAAAIPPGFAEALARQRQAFRETAAGWSSAFGSSSEAKEAVSLALELLGDPAALDTLRLARRLALSPAREWRLLASEVRLLVRFGLPDDLPALRRARVLADSLLASPPREARSPSEVLELLAVVRGRCAAAMRYAAERDASADESGIPAPILSESRVLLDRIALRCDPPGDERALAELSSRIDAHYGAVDPGMGFYLDMTLLMRPALLASRRDSGTVERVARTKDYPLARAARALVRHDTAAAVAALRDFDASGHEAMPITPDVAFMAAKLWADVGDRGRATRLLDGVLARVRSIDPNVLREPGGVAGLMRLARWRAVLAVQSGDRATARRWQQAVEVLQDN